MVLFLDRVYGIENQDFLLHVLDVGFLPDMRAAASLDTVSRPTYLTTLPAPTEDMTWIMAEQQQHFCFREQSQEKQNSDGVWVGILTPPVIKIIILRFSTVGTQRPGYDHSRR